MSKERTIKSVWKKSLCLLLAVLAVMNSGLCVAFADRDVCADAKGSSAKTVTIQVTTEGSAWSGKPYIKLKQTKGTMSIYVLRADGSDYTADKEMYEYYLITLYKLVDGRYRQQGDVIKWSGSETKKIKLDKNSTYQIEIEPYAVKYKSLFNFGPALNPYPYAVFPLKLWAPDGWVTDCSWKVSSSERISSCELVS